MSKQALRSFALGILMSVSIIGSYYYIFGKDQGKSDKTSIKQLEKQGYIVMDKDEYQAIQTKLKGAGKPDTETKQEAATPVPPPAPSPSEPVKQNEEETFTLDVKSGMNSDEIVGILAANKIIEDKKEFSEYLVSKNYASKIQLGQYELTSDMSYEQLAKAITKAK